MPCCHSVTARRPTDSDHANTRCAGSSLTVFSGYRFVRRAAKQGTPVVIVNLGPTRGDGEATARIDADVVQVLPELAATLA